MVSFYLKGFINVRNISFFVPNSIHKWEVAGNQLQNRSWGRGGQEGVSISKTNSSWLWHVVSSVQL